MQSHYHSVLKSVRENKAVKQTTAVQEMIDQGLLFLVDGKVHITRVGIALLDKKLKKVNKVWTEGQYSAKELQMNSMRPGAYDFLKCPSLIGDTRVYKKML